MILTLGTHAHEYRGYPFLFTRMAPEARSWFDNDVISPYKKSRGRNKFGKAVSSFGHVSHCLGISRWRHQADRAQKRGWVRNE